ncbi:lysophospholipase [Microbulbifer sp. CAU 1566]|uniref:alpha/beta hydrolase n=1 Tax=Microbulbifer sp. CAU 1566 TaxID=2933269 RepID=UPI00200380FB|nr:lysophospholipase [Microbulbifer sp. CAU 1566]
MYFESRGIRMHYRRWWVEGANGVVVISHGLGEHSGRYRELARKLNSSGYSVYALDHYGHGQSPGGRGDIDAFSDYSLDLCRFIQLVRFENTGQPLHLLGHSMGGVIACGSVVLPSGDCTVESLILSAPAFKGRKEPGAVEVGLIRLLEKLCPRLPLSNRLDTRWISRDPAVVAAYGGDDLVHDRVTPRWFIGYQQFRAQLLAKPAAVEVPCLMLLPGEDRLVDSEVSCTWFDRLQGDTHRLCHFPAAYHEVFNEPGTGDEALALLINHLNAISRHGVLPQRESAAG